MIYDHIGGIRDPLKQDLALEFCRNQSKVISILTETHFSHDQIHHVRNNWLGSNFFSLGDSHSKGCLYCFIWDLKVSLRLILFQKRGLCHLSLLPLMTEISVFMPFQGIAPENSWIGGASLKYYKTIWKIKIRK